MSVSFEGWGEVVRVHLRGCAFVCLYVCVCVLRFSATAVVLWRAAGSFLLFFLSSFPVFFFLIIVDIELTMRGGCAQCVRSRYLAGKKRKQKKKESKKKKKEHHLVRL